MAHQSPKTTIDHDYSYPNASATPWGDAEAVLNEAEIFWLSTVRPDGRPHVTPLIAVWLDGTLYFCTGAHERKARNIAGNPHVILTTGRNSMREDGLDLVLGGDAVRVTDTPLLQRVADLYEQKYGADWHFDVVDQGFSGQGGNVALVFAVAPDTAFGFGKGTTFSQTRWQF